MQRARPYPRPRIRRGLLHDAVAALVRVGVGWTFAGYGLALRDRGAAVSEHLAAAGLGALSPAAVALPALLVSLAIAFAVGLLTWLTGPLLAVAAVLGTLAADAPDLAPFSSWGTTSLVSAVCVLMAVSGGRWSWDHLVLSRRAGVRHRQHRRHPSGAHGKGGGVSPRLPEHAPPLLYPVDRPRFDGRIDCDAAPVRPLFPLAPGPRPHDTDSVGGTPCPPQLPARHLTGPWPS